MNTIDIIGDENTFRQIVERTIESIVDDEVTLIGSYAFYSCSRLTTASFPACTSIGDSAFCRCSSLTTISFPACTSIGNSAFYSCSSLTTISFPACTTIRTYAFCSCSRLTTASFPACTSIFGSAFYRCSSLSEIYIGTSNCWLAASVVFSSTSITSTTGSIYVPAEHVDAYKSSTNWQYFSNRIFGYNF